MIANLKRYAMRDINLKPMAQQTAVEWLLSELQIRLLKIKSEPNGIVRERMINSFLIDAEQAEAMEKEQRIKDYNAGYTDAQCNHINDAENYANEQEYLNNNLKIN